MAHGVGYFIGEILLVEEEDGALLLVWLTLAFLLPTNTSSVEHEIFYIQLAQSISGLDLHSGVELSVNGTYVLTYYHSVPKSSKVWTPFCRFVIRLTKLNSFPIYSWCRRCR